MADLTHDETAQISSSVAQSIVAMDRSHNETETGLTSAFNQTATEQTATFDAAVDAFSIFTIDQTHNGSDTSLTADFNTEFVATIVYDVLLEPSFETDFGTFDPGGKPIIFYERTTPEPAVFYERTSGASVIFHSRGITLQFANITEDGLTAPYDLTGNDVEKRVYSADSQELITMDQTHNGTDTSLTAAFTTAVA